MVSLWHFTHASEAYAASAYLEDLVDKFCAGMVPYGPYKDNVLEHYKENFATPEKVQFVSYVELKADPKKQIKLIAEFLTCPFHGNHKDGDVEEIARSCSFEHISNYEANKSGEKAKWLGLPYNAFFRKGEVGDHENHLNKEQ